MAKNKEKRRAEEREKGPSPEEVAIQEYEMPQEPKKVAPLHGAQAQRRREAAVRLLQKALRKGRKPRKKK